MTYEFTTTRHVEFADTDMAGIVHFANYFRYMESAEHEFFRSLGLSVHESSSSDMMGFARVKVSCDYRAPLRYQDIVEIHLLVAEMGEKSISYVAEFRISGDSAKPLVAIVRWTVVCIAKQCGDTKLSSVQIPDNVRAIIQVAPEHKLPAKGK